MNKRVAIAVIGILALLVGALSFGGLFGGSADLNEVVANIDDSVDADHDHDHDDVEPALLAGFGPPGGNGNGNGGGGSNKVDVCHITGNGGVNKININKNALPAHRGHGDAIPGELVPGSSTLVYDEDCNEVSFGIDIEKATNGADADTPTGPFVAVGATVSWTYDVTNTGGGTLVNVAVVDDQGVAVSCPQTTLDAGESMTCTASASAVAGQYANVGTASGVTKGVDGDEQYLIPANQGQPTDSDASHYFGSGPGIDIEKATNGADADAPTGPSVLVGDPVNWTYVVTNTGNVALTGVTVTDDQGVAVTCPQTTLAAGESMTCTGNGTAVVGQYANEGTATGTPPVGPDVSDSDLSHYLGVDPDPQIEIEKATEDSDGVFQDADTAPGPELPTGTTVNWQYVVTNSGNVDLTNVTVTDDRGVAVSCPQTALAPGESMTCTGSGTVLDGQYQNVGTATGLPPGGEVGEDEVSDNDASHYFGVRAAVDIEKSTDGFDADTAPGPELTEGDPVAWTYVVTNIGVNQALENVVVTDDQGVAVTCPQTTLAIGESMTCTGSGTVVLGQYANIGTVVADVVGISGTVTDSDPSHYLGVELPDPSIQLEKSTNGVDADVAPGPTLPVGGIVTWTYSVTNTGNVALFPVVVTDSDASLVLDCTELDEDGPLEPGETRECTATGPVQAGQYMNLGSLAATPVDGQGEPLGLPDITANDPSHYFGGGAAVDVDIEKFTEDRSGELHDADSAPGPTLFVGDTVGWVYEVTNTGSATLDNITVTDDQGVTVSCLDDNGNEVNGIAGLTPGGILRCSGSGIVTAGLYANVGTVTADEFGGSDTATDSDPSHYTGVTAPASIDIEKATNGSDADVAPGPILSAGDSVTWTYVVTNDGLADLTNVQVDDNDASLTVDCGTGIPDPLVAGASHTCTATGTAEAGQYQNIGVATGEDPDGNVVTDSDSSHYFVAPPAGAGLVIEKTTNGVDADTPSEAPEIPEGDTVAWVYTVTNTGDVDLLNVMVTDDKLGLICDLTIGGTTTSVMVPGQTEQCEANGTATVGPYTNLGTVTANHSCLTVPPFTCSTITASDPSNYLGLAPVTIDVEKATNGSDADDTPVAVTTGDTVTWSYVVTNTSDVTLTNIAVSDDLEGPVTCPSTTLASGASMTCTDIVGVAGTGSYVNVATATGEAADGRLASDSDSSRYFAAVAAAGVDIEKSTNGVDADSAPGPSLIEGTEVTWTYQITNTGNVAIGFGFGVTHFLTITDSDTSLIPQCSFSSLLPGEIGTCTATGVVDEAGTQYMNTGTAEVRFPGSSGPVVASDTDDSHYLSVELDTGR